MAVLLAWGMQLFFMLVFLDTEFNVFACKISFARAVAAALASPCFFATPAEIPVSKGF